MLIEDLVPEVAVEARLCPEFTIERALRNAATRYCMDTDSLRETFEDTPSGGLYHFVALPEGYQVHHVLSLFHGTQELKEATHRRLTAYQGTDGGGRPAVYIVRSDYNAVQFEFNSPPTEAVRGEVAIKPTPECKEFPDLWANAHYRPIQFLALSDVFSMPGKSWSDPKLSMWYLQKYKEETAVMNRTPSRRRTARFSW